MLLFQLLLSASITLCLAFVPRDLLGSINDQALHLIARTESQPLKVRHYGARGNCTIKNADVRRDWAALSTPEKKEYINAVLCLQSKKAITPSEVAPGAKTRYDDFVATHINQTLTIHGTGNFFGWHRYLVWAYEKALREECGYRGYQPYWNWGTHAADQTQSPVFDGSDTSMSGDSEYVKHNGSLAGGGIWIPSGAGGGCLKSGPFKNMTVHLGPISPGMDGITPAPGNGLQDNPHCLRRDISNSVTKTYLTTEHTVNIIKGSPDIKTFDGNIEGRFDEGYLGPHASGHFVMGGDGTDFFSSIVDPAFWFHHAMLDRVWFLWQSLDAPARYSALYGTRTVFNIPPSPNTTLDDLQDLGVNGAATRLGDLMNTLDGPFCYVYQ